MLSNAIVALAGKCHEAAPDAVAKLNFVLTNGHLMFACRWNSAMHIVVREDVYDCEICGIPHIHHNSDFDHRAVVIASEPITHERWNEIPNHSLMYVSPNLTCAVEPILDNKLAKVKS